MTGSTKAFIGFLIVIAIVFVAIIGGLFYASTTAYDVYKDETHLDYKDIDFNKDKNAIYYFYQDDCYHCHEAKSQIAKFAKDLKDTNTKFYLVNLEEEQNADGWYEYKQELTSKYGNENGIYDPTQYDPEYKGTPEKILKGSDIKITGTPSMIYLKDGKVNDFTTGKAIFDTMLQVAKDNGKDGNYDSSVMA